MKASSSIAVRLAIVSLIAVSTGCATVSEPSHEHHKTAPVSQSAGKDEAKPAAGKMAMMESKAMCDMHNNMMATKTAEERDAMMKEHMKNMSPQARQEKMEMMRNKCK